MKTNKIVRWIIVVFLAITGTVMARDLQPQYQIIYLNGPSSAGKSSLAHQLQEHLLPTPFLHLGIDRMIAMMPMSMNNWVGGESEQGFSWKTTKDKQGNVLSEIQMGPFAQKISESLREVVITLAKQGHYLIIDDVAFGKQDVDKWRKSLSEFRVLWVGVHAPLQEIEKREKARGDRMPGSARHQFLTVHQDVVYDLDIDTHELGVEGSAQRVLELLR